MPKGEIGAKAMIVRILLILVGLAHIVNGGSMLLDPAAWYHGVPGVAGTGPFNAHFIQDIGLIFIASGAGLTLGAKARHADFALAGATWPALHALLHIYGWIMHGFPHDMHAAMGEVIGVVGLGALGLILALIRFREEGTKGAT